MSRCSSSDMKMSVKKLHLPSKRTNSSSNDYHALHNTKTTKKTCPGSKNKRHSSEYYHIFHRPKKIIKRVGLPSKRTHSISDQYDSLNNSKNIQKIANDLLCALQNNIKARCSRKRKHSVPHYHSVQSAETCNITDKCSQYSCKIPRHHEQGSPGTQNVDIDEDYFIKWTKLLYEMIISEDDSSVQDESTKCSQGTSDRAAKDKSNTSHSTTAISKSHLSKDTKDTTMITNSYTTDSSHNAKKTNKPTKHHTRTKDDKAEVHPSESHPSWSTRMINQVYSSTESTCTSSSSSNSSSDCNVKHRQHSICNCMLPNVVYLPVNKDSSSSTEEIIEHRYDNFVPTKIVDAISGKQLDYCVCNLKNPKAPRRYHEHGPQLQGPRKPGVAVKKSHFSGVYKRKKVNSIVLNNSTMTGLAVPKNVKKAHLTTYKNVNGAHPASSKFASRDHLTTKKIFNKTVNKTLIYKSKNANKGRHTMSKKVNKIHLVKESQINLSNIVSIVDLTSSNNANKAPIDKFVVSKTISDKSKMFDNAQTTSVNTNNIKLVSNAKIDNSKITKKTYHSTPRHANKAHHTTPRHANKAHHTTPRHANKAHHTTPRHANKAHHTTPRHANKAHHTTPRHANKAHHTTPRHANKAHHTTPRHANKAHHTTSENANEAHYTTKNANDAHYATSRNANEPHYTTSRNTKKSHHTISKNTNKAHRTTSRNANKAHHTTSKNTNKAHHTTSRNANETHHTTSRNANEAHHTASKNTNEAHHTASKNTNKAHHTASKNTNQAHHTASKNTNQAHHTASKNTNKAQHTASKNTNEAHHTASKNTNKAQHTASKNTNEAHHTASKNTNKAHHTTSKNANKIYFTKKVRFAYKAHIESSDIVSKAHIDKLPIGNKACHTTSNNASRAQVVNNSHKTKPKLTKSSSASTTKFQRAISIRQRNSDKDNFIGKYVKYTHRRQLNNLKMFLSSTPEDFENVIFVKERNSKIFRFVGPQYVKKCVREAHPSALDAIKSNKSAKSSVPKQLKFDDHHHFEVPEALDTCKLPEPRDADKKHVYSQETEVLTQTEEEQESLYNFYQNELLECLIREEVTLPDAFTVDQHLCAINGTANSEVLQRQAIDDAQYDLHMYLQTHLKEIEKTFNDMIFLAADLVKHSDWETDEVKTLLKLKSIYLSFRKFLDLEDKMKFNEKYLYIKTIACKLTIYQNLLVPCIRKRTVGHSANNWEEILELAEAVNTFCNKESAPRRIADLVNLKKKNVCFYICFREDGRGYGECGTISE
nr:uncharacterized protein LOC123758501 [Procambarus clarkii]